MRSASFWMLVVASTFAVCGYSLLLSVVPLWVAHGGVGAFGAGVSTAVFMLVTVVVQLGVPWLLGRAGHRILLAIALVLMGLPAPLLALSDQLAPVLLLIGLRGIGFGLFTVVGNALIVELVTVAEHGRAIAWYGMALSVPQMLLMPAGVGLVSHLGFPVVFGLAAAPMLGLLPLAFVRPIRRLEQALIPPVDDLVTGGRISGLVWPTVSMAGCAIAQGGLITFLPLAVPGSGGLAVPIALFGSMSGTMLGRLAAGYLHDRRGLGGRILQPGTLLAGLGMLGELAAVGGGWPGATVLLTIGAIAVGVGFGLVQNDAMVSMFATVGPRRYSTASAAWNVGYDGGTGVGALALGALAQPFGFPIAFGTSATLLLVLVSAQGCSSTSTHSSAA